VPPAAEATNSVASIDDRKKPAEMTEDELQEAVKAWPGYYTFKGYMAWALWGHIPMAGLEDFQATKYMTSDKETGTDGGRKASRKAAAKAASDVRSNEPGRGVSVADAWRMRESEAKVRNAMAFERSVDQTDLQLLKESLKEEIEATSDDMLVWQDAVMERRTEIFTGNPEDHERFYSTYPPYKEWYDAAERKRTAVSQMNKLTKEIYEHIANKKRKVEDAATCSSVGLPSNIVVDTAAANNEDATNTEQHTTTLSTDDQLDEP
jgi:hypothetical protein